MGGGPGRARWVTALVVVALTLGPLAACTDTGRAADGVGSTRPTDAELVRQGGDATVDDDGASAFAQFVPGLTGAQRRTFAVGNSFFNQNWVTAPASTEGRDGLGPIFNAQSCSSCHFKDGRGRPPEDDDDPERGLLIRLSVVDDTGAAVPHPQLGGQLQDRSIRGVPAEGEIRIEVTERPGRYPDGTSYSLGAPTYTLVTPDGTVIEDILVSPRVAPAMMGVGLLENVPESVVETLADPRDADRDGVSGRTSRLIDPDTGEQVLGRFGWKAAVPTVRAQNAAAFANDIGITSSLVPDAPCSGTEPSCQAAPNGGEPEVPDEKLDQITFYTRTLAVPARREVGSKTTRRGERLFDDVGCTACHVAELTTGPSELASLDRQTIRPHTDLLLHDMGPDLADDRPDGDASGTEWRTPPLWGIGLVETVNDHTRFLHDGRARTLEEAILWHGGEAHGARVRFSQLGRAERNAILDFLRSL